jgi:hypothetical protein
MNLELLWLIVTMDIGVLLTYIFLFDSADISSLTKAISMQIVFCALLTNLISFIYISIQWIWFLPSNPNTFGAFTIYFLGALLRAPLTADAIHRDEKTTGVLLSLILSGTGSIGIMIVSLQHNTLLIIASIFFMLHHVVLDVLWYMRWHLLYSADALFTLDSNENVENESQTTSHTTNYSQYNEDLQNI